jgi:hypothetical protein
MRSSSGKFEIRDSRFKICLAVILLCLVGMGASAQTTKRRVPIFRQIDHILIESKDPKALFSFFSDILRLPVDSQFSGNQGFVSAGNVNLEVFRFPEQQGASVQRASETHYSGLAFEPNPLEYVLKELQASGIPYSPPETFESTLPGGKRGVASTRVVLPSVSRPALFAFLIEHSPVFLQVDARRKQLLNQLAFAKGGPLGLLSVDEILITTPALAKDKEKWGMLFGRTAGPERWRAGEGPAIRLASGAKDEIREIVLKVESLDYAKDFLKKNGLLGPASAKDISINPSKVQGLRILIKGNS